MVAVTRIRPSTESLLRLGFYLLLAFCFLGARPIWDPDEGRYTNVALNMLERGDWVHPMRSEEAGHWTKPPLTYWAIAASVGAFGYSPRAARLPAALSFLACIFLAGRLARRLAPEREPVARLVFATMALPLAAATLITTDFLLAATLALAMWGYVEARFGDRERSRRWVLLMWLGFGLAFLTKGPPALLPWLPIVAMELLGSPLRRVRLFRPEAIGLFLLLSFGWFAWVTAEQPALISYFLGDEVVRRIVGDGFDRNAQWYGWLLVYAPTLLIGSLPWTLRVLRSLSGAPSLLRGWWSNRYDADATSEARVLTLLWLALPLAVLCVAQSRLPLYVLPLFVPLALLLAQASGAAPRLGYGLMIWVLCLLGLRLAVAWWPTHKNAEQWADAIRERAPGRVREVVFVDDMARYGLHLHLGAEVEKLSLADPESNALDREADHGFRLELSEDEPGIVFVTKVEQFAGLNEVIQANGQHAVLLGEPYRNRAIFAVVPNKRCLPQCLAANFEPGQASGQN
ncbi:MAG: glycosyltransferase family 39 protein [Xanthomonadales bacterium]|nr:glycosyltransferase family 39 protein [Xanthomonadales bacterium]